MRSEMHAASEREGGDGCISFSGLSLPTYQRFAQGGPRITDSLQGVVILPILLPGPAPERLQAESSALPRAQKFSVLLKVAAVERGCYSQTLRVSAQAELPSV